MAKKTDHEKLMEFRDKQAIERATRQAENSMKAKVKEGSDESFNYSTGQFEQ